MKCTRHRCHDEPSTFAAAAFSPSWASEITSFTPRKPRRVNERRKSLQNVSASLGITVAPMISRRPCVLTATAIITATETIRPLLRTFT